MHLYLNGVKIGTVNARRTADHYHHGDLGNALVDAATALARAGGPDAVVLREAARRVGVSSAAAYHHFASHEELIQAVKQRALADLTERMAAAVARTGDLIPPARSGPRPAAADLARQRLRALGTAYLDFAFDEAGLFRVTFGSRGRWPTGVAPAPHHGAGAGAFELLGGVLDELAAAGAIPPERRDGLDYIAWAAVHGIAVLCLDGPLTRLDPARRQQLADRALDTIIRGL